MKPERVQEALAVIDEVQAFYARLGIRGEKEIDPLVLFRLRLIHATAVATALAASRRRRDGLADPLQRDFRSVGALLDALLTDLAEEPL